jgi:hypothetical protein
VEAINIYVHEHGLTGLAVCSRLEDYSADRIFLRKAGGVYLHPPTDAGVFC